MNIQSLSLKYYYTLKKHAEIIFIIFVILNIVFMAHNLIKLSRILGKRRLILIRTEQIRQKYKFLDKQSTAKILTPQLINPTAISMDIEPKSVSESQVSRYAGKLMLLGIFQGENKFAYLKTHDHKISGIFKEGEYIDTIKINKILHDHVVLDINGKDEVLFITYKNETPPSNTSIVNRLSDEQYIVHKETILPDFNNILSMVNNLKIHPQFSETTKKIEGLKISNVPADSIVERLGLKDSDIIATVNGKLVDGIPKAIDIIKQLQLTEEMEVNIIRDGSTITKTYHISN